MNASSSRYCRRSFRHPVACIAAMALVAMLGACDKKGDAAGSASTNAASTAPAAGGKKPKTTLKLADLKKVYGTEIDSPSKMKDPMDKKVDAFVAKVGKPQTDNGRTKIWYALDGDKCSKVTIDGKDGSITDETTDKSDCGM